MFLWKLHPSSPQIKSGLWKWTNSPLSLMGETNTIKINVLPNSLYLFKSVPLSLHKSFVKQLHQTIRPVYGVRKPLNFLDPCSRKVNVMKGVVLLTFSFHAFVRFSSCVTLLILLSGVKWKFFLALHLLSSLHLLLFTTEGCHWYTRPCRPQYNSIVASIHMSF